ncbi:PilC/PilY family type IV pilus protein [Arenimonas sp. MALMAid1274]|uniref:PilC/PilY family type IV pilus protein n=1 Tax=Arenimonas sp. MALMAid1274 TaxID=3411630 RepID=UPI003B9F71FB
MNTQYDRPSSRSGLHAPAVLAAAFATLFALPVQAAIDIPNAPLQVGGNVPPNIMFILDTSGSMEDTNLIDNTISISGGGLTTNDLSARLYLRNTLYYNPNATYAPWRRDYGTPLPTPSYNAAYDSLELASGNLNLQDSVQTYYVPKPGATDLTDGTQYYRYQILTNGRVVRSERQEVSTTTEVLVNLSGLSANRNNWVGGGTGATAPGNISFVVPANTTNMTVTLSGSDANANLYLRRNNAPTTGTYDFINNGNSSNESRSVNNPNTGTWYVGVRAADNNNNDGFANVQLVVQITTGDPATGEASAGCATSLTGWGWRNCTYTTPTGRSEAAERQNFATWFSYHRTRMKAAKAGVSYAFSDLGEDFRVGIAGLSSINSRIPVGSDGGLFRNKTTAPVSNNRAAFFDTVFGMTANGFTPLRTALRRVGEYYRETGNTGPYAGTGTTQLACRQNFSILTTDGYWNNNDDIASSNFTSMSGDEDAGTTINGELGATYTYTPARPYEFSQQGTLADVAMHYWKTDLRPDGATGLDNNVPSSSANPAFWQHMVTFGISLGLKGTLDSSTDLPAITAGTLNWGAVNEGNDEDPDKIDDLWHAAVNSRGSFVAATDPNAFAAAIRNALATVVERTASSSNVAANSTSLTSETRLFQARYVSGRWIGELAAYPVSGTTISETPSWVATEEIPAPGARTIITWNGSGGTNFPSPAQAAALNSPIAGVSDYIRGVRTLEAAQNNGGNFRDRLNVLGDIIHSSPVYVEDTDTVYVGANDGMMHAFDASTGEEQFAYVPGNIDLASLESMSSINYGHAYFVDGPIAVSALEDIPGTNYLVGSLGRGGKGVYALDVTDPSSFGNGDVLWDHDPVNHDKMGMVLSTPLITRLNNGDVGVIVANGPNSTGDTAVLYVLNAATGAVLAEIDTGTGTGWGGATAPNGLSGIRGFDVDGNKTIDYVYGGDLRGNVWKFDLTATTPATWDDADKRRIMFTAVDSASKRQPISGTPAVGIDPLTYKTWVFIGTGRYMNADDLARSDGTPNTDVQTWYGLIDDGTAITGRGQLQQRRIAAVATINGRRVRAFEANSALNATVKGWYIDLVTPPAPGTAEGERMIGANSLVGTTLISSSITPRGEACESGGSGFVNALNAFSGSSVATPFFDADNDGAFSDDTIDIGGGVLVGVGSYDAGVDMVGDSVISGNLLMVGGSNAQRGRVPVDLSEIYGRKSWREVIGD